MSLVRIAVPTIARPLALWVAAIAAAAGGCGPKATIKDYEPKSEDARSVLEKALTAWKQGQPAGKLAGTEKPAIQVEDFQWKAGKKLKSFQIESELPATEGATKQFSVKLEVAGAAAQTATYYVVGRDPLWVYRDKDWDKQGGG